MSDRVLMGDISPVLQRFLAVALLVVAGGLFWVMIVLPIQSFIEEKLASIEIGQERLLRYASVDARAEVLEAWDQAGRGARTRQYLYEATTASLGTASLQGDVETMARRLGITIRNARALPERSEEDVARIGIRANFNASHRELMKFLQALAGHPKFLEVTELNIASPTRQADGVETELRIDTEIVGYMRVESEIL